MAEESSSVGRLRALVERHPDATNSLALAVIGIVTTAIGLTGIWSSFGQEPVERWWHLAIILPASAILLAKRRWPVLTLVLGLPLVAVDTWLGGSLGGVLVLFDLIYGVGLYGRAASRRWMLRVLTVGIVAITVIVAVATADLRQGALVGLQAFAFFGAPYWWATSIRQKTELAELERRRADDLLRLAGLREAALLDDERARMARDLHDAIAGHLSAMAIHSEAALSRPAQEEGDRAALRSIRASSVSSLTEMRTMIDLLRAGADPVSAAGGVERLPEFADAARAAGLSVDFDPEELDGLPALPDAVNQAASRVLQEAMTNASKHAIGGSVAVRISSTPENLHLEVESVAVAAASRVSTAGGFGLLAMRDRAQLLGGRLTAGWLDERAGRWLVSADLPLGRAS